MAVKMLTSTSHLFPILGTCTFAHSTRHTFCTCITRRVILNGVCLTCAIKKSTNEIT